MNYVGIDLHKKTITIHVVDQERKKGDHKRLTCLPTPVIVDYFKTLVPFQAVVAATASYEWLVRLLEPLGERIILAHPQKLRIIAESTRKSDKIDAQVLSEFLALDMIPQAYRPTPRQREHRVLVQHRCYLQRRITSVRARSTVEGAKPPSTWTQTMLNGSEQQQNLRSNKICTKPACQPILHGWHACQ